MIQHVISLAGDNDPYAPACGSAALTPVTLRLSATDGTRLHENSLWRGLALGALKPPQVAVDLYRVAATVFSADLRIPRSSAFDRWQRHFYLHLPVEDPALWASVSPRLKIALEFLTGDTWDLAFRQRTAPGHIPGVRGRVPHSGADKVCLVSGGLDSFAGAVDEVATGHNLICVSHNAAGSATFSSPAQERTLAHLAAIRGPGAVSHLKANVSPPLMPGHNSEPTQRSRSIMFIGLGVLTASALAARRGQAVPLVIPENGFISLNVPLTSSRIGSLSTRTTHPFFLEHLSQLLAGLGLNVTIETPYRYRTKGQILTGVAHPAALVAGARETVSCAHPSIKRFAAARANHCGYCVPCIVRRAAMRVAGLDDPADYSIDLAASPLLTQGQMRDVRAFEIALANRSTQVSRSAILAVGPLPGSDAIAQSVAVYEAGLNEVADFLP